MALRLSTGLRNKQLGINTTKVSNGTFTTDATGWTASVATITGGVSYDGYTCLRVDTAAGYGYQAITVKPGHTYKLVYEYQNGGAGNASLNVGTTFGGTDVYASGVLSTTSWTEVTAFFTVPAGTTTVYINANCSTAAPQYYDNIVLTSVARSIQDLFAGGDIKIYSGVQPTSADDAPSGTLLVTINNAGSGVTFDDASSGVISKAAAETWSGICANTGTAGWARLSTTGDGLGSSTTDERIDMAVGTSGAQINFSSTSFASGATQTITTFTITLPAV